MMYFIAVMLIGLMIPFLFYRVKAKWAKWVPGIVFVIGALAMGFKAKFFPGPEMQVLGEIVYFMILGSAAIGAMIGGIMVKFMQAKK